MTPKEIAEKIEKGIAGIPRWRMFWDFKVGDLADFVADYKRQSEEIKRLEGHNLRNFNLAQDNIKEVNRLNDFIVKMTKEVEETIARIRSAEPVAWSLIFNEKFGVNPETTFKTEAKAEDYAKKCGAPKPIVVPLYGKPEKPAGLLDGPLAKRDMEITRQSELLEEARKGIKEAFEEGFAAVMTPCNLYNRAQDEWPSSEAAALLAKLEPQP